MALPHPDVAHAATGSDPGTGATLTIAEAIGTVTAGQRLIVVTSAFQDAPVAVDCNAPAQTAGTATLGSFTHDAHAADAPGGGGNSISVSAWSAPVTGSGTCTISVTLPTTTGATDAGLGWSAGAFPGLDLSGTPVDAVSVGTGYDYGGAVAAPDAGTTTGTTTAANELALVLGADWGSGTAWNTTGTGQTIGTNGFGLEAGMSGHNGDSVAFAAVASKLSGSGTHEGGKWGTAGLGSANVVAAVAVVYKLAGASPTNAMVTPAALAATTVLPAPTITTVGPVSVPVSVLAAAAVLPAPTIVRAGPVSVPVPPLAAAAAVPAPSTNTGGVVNASVSVAAVAATVGLPAPVVAAGISASVSIPALAATAQLLLVSASQAFSADPLAATVQLPAPVISGKISVTVSVLPVAATVVLPAPPITFGFPGNTPVPVPALAATTQLPAPAVAAGDTIPVPVLAATTQLPPPTIFAGFVVPVSLAPPALAATAVLPAPIITIGSGVLLPALAVTTQFPAPAIVTVDVALPIVAYLFTPPVSNYVPPVPADRDGHNDPGWRLMKYHHPTPRGVNVFKLSDGTYPRDDVTGVWPTTPEVPNDALSSVWGVGSLSPIITPIDPEVIYVYYGGHSYLVDDAEAGRLTAAGYGSNLVGVNQDQIDVMTAQGWGFDTSGVLV